MDAVNPGTHVNQPKSLRLIACPHVLSIEKDRLDRMVPAGGTVAAHLHAIGWQSESVHARVWIDGVFIEQARWESAVPEAGQSLVVRAIPMDNQGGGKDVGRLVAMIGILALAFVAPQLIGATGFLGSIIATTPGVGAALTAAVSIIGTLAITGRIPPARPRLCDQRPVHHV